MAVPMTSTQIETQLKKWKVNYKKYQSWATHNRNHKGPWGPVHGILWHHTGSDNKDQRDLLYSGRPDLPGPLCHFGIARDGTVWLVGWGRANHAGEIDDDVLNALINEKPLPVDNEANIDGNARLYGIEIWYSGSKKMTDAQYLSSLLVTAAICDWHGWTGKSALGHGEVQPGKWDPGLTDMNKVRWDVTNILTDGLKGSNVAKSMYQQTLGSDQATPPKHVDRKKNKFWQPISIIRHAAEQAYLAHVTAKDNSKKLDVIGKKLKEIEARLPPL